MSYTNEALRNFFHSFFALFLLFFASSLRAHSDLSVAVASSTSSLSIYCEQFLLGYSEQWRPILRAGLEGQSMNLAALELSGEILYSHDQKHNGILDRAILDELRKQQVKSSKDVKRALMAFSALEPHKKIEFIENVAERIVNALEAKLEICDLVSVSKFARIYGMCIEDYVRFLGYWKRNYLLDPNLSELKFSILYHLANNINETSTRIAKLSRFHVRLRDYFAKRKEFPRIGALTPLHDVYTYAIKYSSFDYAKKNGAFDYTLEFENIHRTEWEFLVGISSPGRDFFIRKNISAFTIRDLLQLRAHFSKEFSDATHKLIEGRLSALRNILDSFKKNNDSLTNEHESIQSRIQEINKQLKKYRPPSEHPIYAHEWSTVYDLAMSIDKISNADKTNDAIDRFFKDYGSRLSAKQYVELFFIFAAHAKRYTFAEPTYRAFEILYENSLGLDIGDDDFAVMAKEIIDQSSGFSDDTYKSNGLSIASRVWGKKAESISLDKFNALNEELESLLTKKQSILIQMNQALESYFNALVDLEKKN